MSRSPRTGAPAGNVGRDFDARVRRTRATFAGGLGFLGVTVCTRCRPHDAAGAPSGPRFVFEPFPVGPFGPNCAIVGTRNLFVGTTHSPPAFSQWADFQSTTKIAVTAAAAARRGGGDLRVRAPTAELILGLRTSSSAAPNSS